MRRLLLTAVLMVGVAVLATAAFGATKGVSKPSSSAAPGTTLVSCKSAKIGGMFPLTGPAPGIGDEQRNWALLGLSQTNKSLKTKFTMAQFDSQLAGAQAAIGAQQLSSDANVLAVVGPAGSQEVISSRPIFKRSGMGFISSSATATTLTQPSQEGYYAGFFRDVPNDSIQSPTIGNYARKQLKAKRIVIIDDQTSYGAPLADGISASLKSHGITATRKSVPRSQTDFSALVTSIPSNTQVVILAWQVASNAQQFARQMREQGKTAKIFGSDGLFDPAAFTVEGAYVSVFAPLLAKSNPYAKAYTKRFHKEYGSFGPPAYVATEIEVAALKTSCKNGTASRAEVAKNIRKTKLKKTPLGPWTGFSSHGDPKGAHFYIYKIVNGKYKLVF